MTKVNFILFFISSSSLLWSVNRTSINENIELNALENKKLIGDNSNNWPNDLFGTNLQSTCILLVIIVNNVAMD